MASAAELIGESYVVFEPAEDVPSRVEMTELVKTRGEVLLSSGLRLVFEVAPKADPDVFKPLPMQLIRRYARTAADRGVVTPLEDGTWYIEVPRLPGVWAHGSTSDEAMAELPSVIEEWAVLKVQDGDRDLPTFGDINLNVI